VSDDQQQPSSIRGGVIWSLATFVGTKAMTFLATLVLARLLAPSEFGVLAAVLAFITFLELISDLGMKATVIYESERGFSDRVQTAFTLNAIFTVVLTGVAVALAPLIADFFGVGSESFLFRIAALDLLLTGLGNIHDALLLRDMEFKRRIVPQLTGNVTRGVVSIGLAVAGLGAEALVYGFIAGTSVWTVTLWIVKPFRPTLRIERDAVRSIVSYGGWASILEILAALAQRTDVAVVGAALGSRALGLYTIAQRVPELVVGNVTWNLSVVAFPALTQRRDRTDGSFNDTTLNLIRFSALFGMTIGAFLAVLAQPLVVVLFGEKWTEAGEIMQALAIMYGLVCIVFPLGDTFKALGKQRTMAAVNAVALPIGIAAMWAASPAGIVAVAWARVGVTVTLGVVWIALITRVLGIELRTALAMLRGGCAGAGGVVVAGIAARIAFPENEILPLVVAGAVAAGGGALALRVLAVREYRELEDMIRHKILRRLLGSGGSLPTDPEAERELEAATLAAAKRRTRSE
jgi:PST family polysaccharide transporter